MNAWLAAQVLRKNQVSNRLDTRSWLQPKCLKAFSATDGASRHRCHESRQLPPLLFVASRFKTPDETAAAAETMDTKGADPTHSISHSQIESFSAAPDVVVQISQC